MHEDSCIHLCKVNDQIFQDERPTEAETFGVIWMIKSVKQTTQEIVDMIKFLSTWIVFNFSKKKHIF